MKIIISISALIIVCISTVCLSATLFEDNFDGYTDSPINHGWSYIGSDVSVVDTGCREDKCIRVDYTIEGTAAYVLSHASVSDYTNTYYSFSFKLTNNNSCGGNKFIKLRAHTADVNYANFTTQISYSSGKLNQIDHGCGTGDTGDQGCGGVYGSGTTWNDNGVVVTDSSPYTFPDENWHHYELYVKWNTDNNYDGAYTVWIDGEVRREITNVMMRSAINTSGATEVRLGDYFRSDSCTFTAYELYYDDVVISDSYIGPFGNTGQTKQGSGNFTTGTGSLQ